MPESSGELNLAICVVDGHRQMDMLLAGLVELGIREAWVLEARGMGDILSVDVPIFAGLGSLFTGAGGDAYVVVSLVPASLLQELSSLLEDVCGPYSSPQSGVLVAVPVGTYRGPGVLMGN